ncbi:hypothetical protein D9M68_214270 [compost metagenome]
MWIFSAEAREKADRTGASPVVSEAFNCWISKGRQSVVKMFSVSSMTLRSKTFLSSRILPGQVCSFNSCMNSPEKDLIFLLVFKAKKCRK